jgi:hypothetical protein
MIWWIVDAGSVQKRAYGRRLPEGSRNSTGANGERRFSIAMPKRGAAGEVQGGRLPRIPGQFFGLPQGGLIVEAVRELRLAWPLLRLDPWCAFGLGRDGIVELGIEQQTRDQSHAMLATGVTEARGGRSGTRVARIDKGDKGDRDALPGRCLDWGGQRLDRRARVVAGRRHGEREPMAQGIDGEMRLGTLASLGPAVARCRPLSPARLPRLGVERSPRASTSTALGCGCLPVRTRSRRASCTSAAKLPAASQRRTCGLDHCPGGNSLGK